MRKHPSRRSIHALAGLVGVLLAFVGVAAQAAPPRLPIAEGIWVETKLKCETANFARMYVGGQIGEAFTYGEGGSLGPTVGMEEITDARPVKGGFTAFSTNGPINPAQMQVKALPGGQAIFRFLGMMGPPGNPGPIKVVWSETARQCPLTSLSPRMRAVIAPYFPAGGGSATRSPEPTAPPAIAPGTPPPVGGGWSVQRLDDGTPYASSSPASSGGLVLSLSCIRGKPTAFAENVGVTAQFVVLDVVNGTGSGSVTLERAGQSRIYTGSVEYGTFLSVVSGPAPTADLKVEGRTAGRLSLAGSTAAIRTALASCWQSAAPAVAASATAPVGPLGIAPGYYVDEGMACGQAFDAFFYDGKRVGVADLSGDGRLKVQPVGRVARQRSGSLLIVALDIELRKLANNRIELTIQDTGPPMRLCARGDVPAKLRAN